jgi:endo-1,4-beta-xylanase
MNIKRIGIFLIIVLFLFACSPDTEPPPIFGSNGEQLSLDPGTLTIGSKKDLKSLLNDEMKTKTITSWVSDNTANVSVDNNGYVTSSKTSFTNAEGGNTQYKNGPARASAVITATALDGTTQTFNVFATTQGWEDISNVMPFKSYFPSNILAGNIAGTSVNANLTRHFNAITAENCMKPDAISNGRNASTGAISYTWTNADNFVAGAQAAGMKIIGHTLLWHQQIPSWQSNMSSATKDVALEAMKKFITEVVTHFKGKIYSWDVLNEIFPDGASTSDWKTAMRPENPWFKAIGSEFVYEGFLAARQADPNAILYYNDYNTDNSNRATLICNMVTAVNAQYKTAFPSETRLLIEGIGMQEHHNLGVTAASIDATLTKFKNLTVSTTPKIKVSVSEIDLLALASYSVLTSSTGAGTNKHNASNNVVTNNQLMDQAVRYKAYMDVYMKYTDIIERISIWGVTDNASWRSGGLPLLFDSAGRAKPAYYMFSGAVKK